VELWWFALVAFSIVSIVLLATGTVGWLDLLGAVLFVVFMILVMATIVVPLWRSALRDVARWTRPPD
jgi:predicted cobalt transporter CbtA